MVAGERTFEPAPKESADRMSRAAWASRGESGWLAVQRRQQHRALGRLPHRTGVAGELLQDRLARLVSSQLAPQQGVLAAAWRAASEGRRASGTRPPAKNARAALSLRIGCRRVWMGPGSSVAPTAPSGRTSWASSCEPASDRGALEGGAKVGALEPFPEPVDVQVRRRVLEAEQQHVGPPGEPDRHVAEHCLVGAQDDLHGLRRPSRRDGTTGHRHRRASGGRGRRAGTPR